MNPNIKFLNSKEKKEFLTNLEEQYGITDLPYALIETGKQKIRGYSGSLNAKDIETISNCAPIEIIGLYLISKKDSQPRINFDALPILKNQITKRIIDIPKENLNSWLRGNDLEIEAPHGFVLIRCGHDLVGVGLSNGTKINNYVPKERKIKSSALKTT